MGPHLTAAYCGCDVGTCPQDASCPRPRLLPGNLPLVRAWHELACTQWRRGGMGQRTGLDYAAVQSVLRAFHPRAWKRLFAGIRVIERALLAVDSEAMERGADEHAH